MSNETDLDWLARNVHVWPAGKLEVLVCWPRNVDTLIWSSVSSDAGWITKDQWLASRAELQNKPGWNIAPKWATHLAQSSHGNWFFFSEKPSQVKDVWSIGKAVQAISLDWKGEALGDWRDTLERRPEITRAEMEVELVKAAFQPFTSIEDNREQVMAQQQEMKQDNGWLERGELPPVGVVCEAYIDYPPQWVEAEIVAHKDGFAIGWCKSVLKGCHGDKASEFRPIRTERDVLLSIIVEEMNRYDTDGKLADAILAAGFKRGAA